MSSHKQLWALVLLLATVLFTATVFVNNVSDKSWLESQLSREAASDAALLAIHLQSQGQENTSIASSSLGNFDASPYEVVQITDFSGSVNALRTRVETIASPPDWFIKLFPITIGDGVAPIVRNGAQWGAVTLSNHTLFAYSALWQQTLYLALVFGIGILAFGTVGSLLLRRMLAPLDSLIEQAESLTGGHTTTAKEVGVRKFRRATRALNSLSQSLESKPSRPSITDPTATANSNIDNVTRMMSREQFMLSLREALKKSTAQSPGTLTIIHLNSLNNLNHIFGRRTTDDMLAAMGRSLISLCMQNADRVCGRLNGSDFALLTRTGDNALEIARDAQAALREVCQSRNVDDQLKLPAATIILQAGESIGNSLTRLDSALNTAINENDSNIYLAEYNDVQVLPVREQLGRWRELFDAAFADLNFSLATFPVAGLEGELLHYESPARLHSDGRALTASQFLPWIHRLDYASDLDRQVVELALQKITADPQPVCINLSANAVADVKFLPWLREKLSANAECAPLLWMEVSESDAYRYLDEFTRLCACARYMGSKMGIEHAGHRLSDIGRLRELDLDYIKIDDSLVHDIDRNTSQQTLVRSLCTIGKSTGVLVIAEGVDNEAQWSMLLSLGIDGVTGPAVSASRDLDLGSATAVVGATDPARH